MTAKEAYSILIKKWGNVRVVKCVEYSTKIVFILGGISGAAAVDKTTQSVSKFIPSSMPLDEYRSGVEITNFK